MVPQTGSRCSRAGRVRRPSYVVAVLFVPVSKHGVGLRSGWRTRFNLRGKRDVDSAKAAPENVRGRTHRRGSPLRLNESVLEWKKLPGSLSC
jgi:hypothetical protein